jgi:MFS family permease
VTTVVSERRGFRLWIGGAGLSELGDSVTFFALGWVAAGHGPGIASLVLTAESVPLCWLILVGGVIADRWGIRRVMIGCDLFMALVMAAFAVGVLVAVPIWSLVLVALLSGTAAALRLPAAGVFPRLFATGDELARTMATATLVRQSAHVTGPSVGGVLLATGGLSVTSALDAVTFAVVLGVLIRVRPPHEPARTRESQTALRQHFMQGFMAVRATPGATATILTIMGLAATILPLVSLCVPIAGHQRGWGAGTTGVVSGAWVVGGMAVMLMVARRGMPGPRTALSGPVVAAGGAVLLATTRSAATATVALCAVGVGTSLLTARVFPRFMNATPPDMLARFQSLLGLAQTGPVLVAMPVLGRVISSRGIPTALVCIAATLVLTLFSARRSAGSEPGVEAELAGPPRDGDRGQL